MSSERTSVVRRRGVVLVVLLLVVGGSWALAGGEPIVLDDAERAARGGRYLRLPDGHTHYDVAGPADAAATTILVHGTTVPSFVWDRNVGALAESGHRVIRYDLYGRGLSHRADVPHDLVLFVRQLAGVVDSLAPGVQLNLVGASIGGIIIAEYARLHPERVRALVMVDPAGVGTALPLAARIALAPVVGEYVMRVAGSKQLRPSRRMFAHPERYPAFDSVYLGTLAIQGSRKAVLSTLRTMPFNDYASGYAALGELGMPTLLIWGTEDRIVPFAASDTVRQLIRPARFLAVPDAGHFPNYEEPDIVNEAMVAFLAPG